MAAKKGIRSVLVTNGYMSKDCLTALSRCICAANVDLKSFSEAFYHKYCGGHLQPVLENLKAIKKLGWWLEVTTLVIPGLNDGQAEMEALAAFIRDELGPGYAMACDGVSRRAPDDRPSGHSAGNT